MSKISELELQITDLEADLKHRDDKIKELRQELLEARESADKMREHVEDVDANVENWIAVFDMQQDDAGVWQFDRSQSEVWGLYKDLLDRHNKLVGKWNKFVGRYNVTVLARDLGRPLGASEAQQTEVLTRHKKGQSLRAIAKEMSLGVRTVRTIIEKANGRDRGAKRVSELRRAEFNRQRAQAFRARYSRRDAMPKQVTTLLKEGAALVKRVKNMRDA